MSRARLSGWDILKVGLRRKGGGRGRPPRLRVAPEVLEGRSLLAATLTLSPIATIAENSLATLAGSVSGLVANNRFELEVTWGDGQVSRIADTADASGNKTFSTTHRYLDDQPSGTSEDTYVVDVRLTEATITLAPDVIFVIDVSGSANDSFAGTAIGDQNGDGLANRIIDAEIAGFLRLNQELIDRGLGNSSRVSLTAFSSGASMVDLDPWRAGIQASTTPLADNDNNGVRDVDQALRALRASGGTNFEAALQTAIQTLTAVGTAPGQGYVIFLSDGAGGGSFGDEVNAIKGPPRNQTLRAFGVGSGSDLSLLRQMDPNAVRFTTTDQLLVGLTGVVGSGGQIGGGTDRKTTPATVRNLAPTLTLNPIVIGRTGSATLTGTISDVGTIDSFTLQVDWGDPTSASNIVTVSLPAGSRNFSLTHQYADPSPADNVVFATLTDDDTGIAFASATVPSIPRLDILDVLVDVGSITPISILNESRVLPWLKVESITFVVAGDVAIQESDLSLAGIRVGRYTPTGFSTRYDAASGRTSATVTLGGLGSGGDGIERLSLSLLGGAFPGGADIRTYDFLPGDFNGDGVVTIRDGVGIRDYTPTFSSYIPWADVDGDGDVDTDDLNGSRRRIGTSLPPRS